MMRQALMNHCAAFCPNVFGAAAGGAALGACDELAEAGGVFVGVVSDRIVSPLFPLSWHYQITMPAAARVAQEKRSKIGGGPAVLPPSPLINQTACKPGSVRPGAFAPDVTAIPLRRRLPGA
jgi:hypothetical protein